MTRPIAALRSPTLMNILTNVALWLHLAVKATSSTRPEQPQLRTSERECPESCRFRPVYPQVRTRRALSVDGEL